jgi:CCR4-NOT transcriptional complex subunit CAF120
MSAVPLGSPNTALTAAEFVQQRAAVPLYAHQRNNSGNVLTRNTPTPPLGQRGQSPRRTSVDLLQRPRSRGAASALTPKQQYAQYQQYPEHMSDYRAPQQQYGNAPPYSQAQYADPNLKLQPVQQGAPSPGHNSAMSPMYSPPPPQFFSAPQFLPPKNEHPNH